jgi:hypothetical protein
MSDLNSEVHRLMLLNSLRNADPKLLRQVLSPNPDERQVLDGLRTCSPA